MTLRAAPTDMSQMKPSRGFWGSFSSASLLPNTPAGVDSPWLQLGDVAAVGAVLYRCTATTPGSATWEAVPTAADLALVTPSVIPISGEILPAGQAGTDLTGFLAPSAGQLLGMTAQLQSSMGDSGQTATLTPVLGGSTVAAHALAFSEDGGEVKNYSFASPGTAFAAGEDLTVRVVNSAYTGSDIPFTALLVVAFTPV